MNPLAGKGKIYLGDKFVCDTTYTLVAKPIMLKPTSLSEKEEEAILDGEEVTGVLKAPPHALDSENEYILLLKDGRAIIFGAASRRPWIIGADSYEIACSGTFYNWSSV